MSVQSASGLTKAAPVIFSLLLGGGVGYYLHGMNGPPMPVSSNARRVAGAEVASPMAAGGGGGGGMGGGQPSSTTALPRLVRNLATIEKVQAKGLSAEQRTKILPLLEQMQSADKLPEKECDAKLAAIEAVLTAEQKQALQSLQPVRGGGGGGGMGGGMMGGGGGGGRGGGGAGGMRGPMSGGPMGGGMMGGGMMGGGGGGQQDPERPFASERNKQALQDLIAASKGS